MRKKILWISQLIMAVVLLIYAVLSTQVFYNNLIAGTEKNLKVYMNLFDIKEYTLDEEGADRFSAELSGLRVTFLNVSGDVLADSEKEELGNHADGLSRAHFGAHLFGMAGIQRKSAHARLVSAAGFPHLPFVYLY